MSAATAGQEEKLWAALGEPSRLRVLDALLDRGDATPTMLAQELPLTRQAVTKHLAVLGRVGLVAGRRQGREVRYAVEPDRLAEAARAMSAVAAQWDRRLARIKAIAEAVHARRQLGSGTSEEARDGGAPGGGARRVGRREEEAPGQGEGVHAAARPAQPRTP